MKISIRFVKSAAYFPRIYLCKLIFVFDKFLFKEHPLGEADFSMSQTLISLWINFAKYGNPTPPFTDNNTSFNWGKAASETFPLFANISGSVPYMVECSEDYNKRMAFWTQLLN